jgi:hypothetical protein
MSPKLSILRLLTRAASIAFLLVVCPVVSDAAPVPPPPTTSAAATATSGDVARQKRISIRKLIRQTRLVRGPVARRFRLALFDLAHRTHLLGRPSQAGARDDDQAIQNDAPATEISADLFVALQPLGLFIASIELDAFTVSFSPRSPRGPPAPA